MTTPALPTRAPSTSIDSEFYQNAGRPFYSRHANNITGPIVVQHPDAVGPGYNLGHPLMRAQDDWMRWYDMQYGANFWPTKPTMANGLAQLQELHALLELPLFRMASDFLADAIMSDPPSLSIGGAEVGSVDREDERVVWWEEYRGDIMRALAIMARYISILDYGVLAALVPDEDAPAEPGQPTRPMLLAINPMYYRRVGLKETRDADAGHILFFPFSSQGAEFEKSAGGIQHEDRIQVVKIFGNENQTATYEFNGEVIGPLVAEQLPSAIRAVYTVGEGDSWYGGAKDTAASLMIDLSILRVEANDYTNRPLYVPTEVVEAIESELGLTEGRKINQASLRRAIYDILRPIIGIDTQTGMPPQDTRQSLDQAARRDTWDAMFDLYLMMSRLTKGSYGFVGAGESGKAREKAQDAAGIRVRRIREQTSNALSQAVKIMQDSLEDMMFTWNDPPFQDRQAREEQLVALYKAGLITPNEARTGMGYGAVEGGDTLSGLQEALDDSITRGDNDNRAPSMRNGGGAQG